jgi:hypothetical protein
MLNLSFSGRRLFGLLAVLTAAPLALTAGDVDWSVTVAFSDGGTLSGDFIFDSDTGLMRTWNLVTNGGDTVNFPPFTYTPGNSGFSTVGNTLIFSGPLFPAINPFPNGFRQLRLGPFNTPLSDAGGGRDLPSDPFGNSECYNCGPIRTASGTLFGTPLPDLTITKSHVGNFFLGQTFGANYNIVVSNAGVGPQLPGNTVTVVDNLPSVLTPLGVTATGWDCSGSSGFTLNCARADGLAAGASYPAIVLSVGVGTFGVPPLVTNTATVSGAGEVNFANNASSDPTTILLPDLTITKSHEGNFNLGQTGAT